MRRIAGFLVVSALAMLITLTAHPSAAFAAAPAPECDSGTSSYVCSGSSTGTTVWTLTLIYPNGSSNTFSSTRPGPTIHGVCVPHTKFTVYYTGIYQGVTQTSGTSYFICNSGTW